MCAKKLANQEIRREYTMFRDRCTDSEVMLFRGGFRMAGVQLTFTDYERQRKHLNTRLGVLLLLLIPLPMLLYRHHVGPFLILLLSIMPPFVLGVLYPTWWRRRHHPNRESTVERRLTMLSLICRPIAFVCGMVAMAAWSVDSPAAHRAGLAAALATGTMLTVPLFFAPKNDDTGGG
jgi:hypothetical protein